MRLGAQTRSCRNSGRYGHAQLDKLCEPCRSSLLYHHLDGHLRLRRVSCGAAEQKARGACAVRIPPSRLAATADNTVFGLPHEDLERQDRPIPAPRGAETGPCRLPTTCSSPRGVIAKLRKPQSFSAASDNGMLAAG